MELHEGDIEWKKDVPHLNVIGKDNPFTTPETYFENLSDQIKSRIHLESFRFSENEEFDLPENYFDELGTTINARIYIEELTGGEKGFTVPSGYFDKLTSEITASTKTGKQNTIRKIIPAWLGYAAAACTTIVMGSILYFNSDQYVITNELSKVPDQEIINYLQVHSTAADTEFIIEQLNPDELENINTDISEEDLEQYLQNTTL